RLVVDELAVDPAQEPDAGRAEHLRGLLLLFLTSGHPGRAAGVWIPGALRPVGADEEVHLGARVGPLGERGAAPELDVVGVRPDREDAFGRREIDPQTHSVGSFSSASAARSAASSTSNPSAWSCTTRTPRPQ